MASQGYRDWLNAGRPYTLIRPAKAIQATLRGYGLTVYDYPNDDHLQADTPQDHTPFSVTGYPGSNARWNARALDVMPRGDSYAARAENADIARQFIADRNAGHPGVMWIKYLNWTDEKGVCRQERWTPNHETRSSTDKGHIHISGRSDVDNDSRADGYDPIARMDGVAMATPAEYAAFNADSALYALNKRQPSYRAVPAPAPAPPAGTTVLTVPNVMLEIEKKIDDLASTVGTIVIRPTDEQWQELIDAFKEQLGTLLDGLFTETLNRTRLSVAPPADAG